MFVQDDETQIAYDTFSHSVLDTDSKMLNQVQHDGESKFSMTRNRMKKGFVYIMSNKQDGVLYIGVTSDIVKRVYEHKNDFVDGFTKQYNLKNLVYYEVYDEIEEAIKREKQLKNWHRDWKIELINKQNPKWEDLYESIL